VLFLTNRCDIISAKNKLLNKWGNGQNKKPNFACTPATLEFFFFFLFALQSIMLL